MVLVFRFMNEGVWRLYWEAFEMWKETIEALLKILLENRTAEVNPNIPPTSCDSSGPDVRILEIPRGSPNSCFLVDIS